MPVSDQLPQIRETNTHQCTNEYSNIFEYFPPNIDIHIQIVAIFKAKYYSN